MSKGNYKIPFSGNRQLTWIDSDPSWNSSEIDMRENTTFWARLKYKDYHKGRSAIGFEVENIGNGEIYYMFLSSLHYILKYEIIHNGEFSGLFTFTKRGQNYGLEIIPDPSKKVPDVVE